MAQYVGLRIQYCQYHDCISHGRSIGNIVTGIPIGPDKEFAGTFWSLINPYTLIVGVTTVSLFMMHGTIYAVMKTEGELQKTIERMDK